MEFIFWMCILTILFVYAGYPLLAGLLSVIFPKKHAVEDAEPTVTMIISAYNEEKVIAEKLNNTLALDYPGERLEIIVASDGSTDQTDAIVQRYADSGVVLLRFSRMGKTGIQNESVRQANGEIVVFSDANAIYRKDAIRKLVRHFGDPSIGCVCGQLVYKATDDLRRAFGETIYWMYEKKLKSIESRLSSLVGVNGSIYAVRKSDYLFLDNELISDFVEPLEIVKNKKRVIYDPEAVSEEIVSESYSNEFNRKIRIFIRSLQGLIHMRSLLNPFRHGWFAFQLISHKLMRYLVPFFLLAAMVSLLFLAHKLLYFCVFLLMLVFLILAIIGKFEENNARKSIICNLFYYYILMNYANVQAWIRVIKGDKMTVWTTERK